VPTYRDRFATAIVSHKRVVRALSEKRCSWIETCLTLAIAVLDLVPCNCGSVSGVCSVPLEYQANDAEALKYLKTGYLSEEVKAEIEALEKEAAAEPV